MSRNFSGSVGDDLTHADIAGARFLSTTQWTNVAFFRSEDVGINAALAISKWRSGSERQSLIDHNTSGNVGLFHNGAIRLRGTFNLIADTWYLVASTCDGAANIKLYLLGMDGTVHEELSGTTTGDGDTTQKLRVGNYEDGSGNDQYRFNGDEAYVSYINATLTANELKDYLVNPYRVFLRYGGELFLPLVGSSPEVDWSGKTQNFSVEGTLGVSDMPPVVGPLIGYDPGIDTLQAVEGIDVPIATADWGARNATAATAGVGTATLAQVDWTALGCSAAVTVEGPSTTIAEADWTALGCTAQVTTETGLPSLAESEWTALGCTAALTVETGLPSIAESDWTAFNVVGILEGQAVSTIAECDWTALDCTAALTAETGLPSLALSDWTALDCTAALPAGAVAGIAECDWTALDCTAATILQATATQASSDWSALDCSAQLVPEGLAPLIAIVDWTALDCSGTLTEESVSALLSLIDWSSLDATGAIGSPATATLAQVDWTAIGVPNAEFQIGMEELTIPSTKWELNIPDKGKTATIPDTQREVILG